MSLRKYKPLVLIMTLILLFSGISEINAGETIDKYGETIEIDDPVFQRKLDIATEFSNLDQTFIDPDDYYSTEPINSGTLTSGTIKDSILEDTMDYLMFIRYVAGLTNTVTMDDKWNLEAQKASLVNFANKNLSHFPADPGNISNSDYTIGYEASSESNLALYTYLTLENSLDQYMLDESSYNKLVLGHRRWLINPFMENVGFGFRHGEDDYDTPRISAVKVFDDNGYTNVYDPKEEQPELILWPSETAFPLEYMKNNIPWSISLDPTLYDSKRTGDIEVTITNRTTGQLETFNSSTKGEDGGPNLSVDTVYMGVPFCLIFIPESFVYDEREIYDVQVNGLYKTSNEEVSLSYSTEFFRVGEFMSNITDSNYYYAESLRQKGLFKGTDMGYELNRVPTRIEGLVMFIRMLGEEDQALAMSYSVSPFTDIPGWANGYAAYAYKKGYTKGIGDGLFGSNLSLSANDYSTFIFRSLNYEEGNSFSWNTALNDFKQFGFITNNVYDQINKTSFTRGDMAALTYMSLK